MNKKARGMVIAVGFAVALAVGASSAWSQGGGGGAAVRAGYLTCHVDAGWGFIFGSSRKLDCAYALQPGYTEYYLGSITKFGADIGYLQSGVIIWAVLAPTTTLAKAHWRATTAERPLVQQLELERGRTFWSVASIVRSRCSPSRSKDRTA
jgi:hypothetical protein